MEGLKVSDANMVVYVHPSKSKKVSQAVLRELGAMLLKFDEKFEGVLLAYEAKIIDKNAKILSGVHPYFGVTIKAKLLLFSPKPNMLLEGKVVKLRQESIHVIVLGFASAVITYEDIRDEFKHRTKHGEEMFVSRAHKHHVIKVGTMIRFLVKSFDEEILHISGSLVPSHTGSIHWLEKNSVEGSVSMSSKKKMRENEGGVMLQDTVGTDVNAVILNDHQPKTKKQKTTRIS
ncbi:putative DNA-directed RNA polymerase I subunit RPA43 [Cucumis melo var. makuwa]|uniref:DNA-directed RNA polymerase subunit n=1 Tax=Cucumis melo var. makuwa TaxID=1194695 RepID=A0A5D3E6A0_CUCMM|nr:putative DNA-directed RNA polymerase I subunit RPA43 [Cucumis melo var. makuwa]TYK31504.1 putative DNA-directed RNA polymerase I subunit RPA43 [Cucumis melo var. makuwa]